MVVNLKNLPMEIKFCFTNKKLINRSCKSQYSQIQELHQQEIQQLKQQYENRIKSLQQQLKCKNQTIQILQRNNKHHMLQLEKTFQMEGMELIECKQNNISKFDESSILNFKQILSQKSSDNKVDQMQQNILQFINRQFNHNYGNLQLITQNIKKQILFIFQYIRQIRIQLLAKVQSYQSLIKKYQENQSNYKKLKTKFDSLQKDSSLMLENLRKTNIEKGNIQKKLIELQKQLKVQQNTKEALLKISLKQAPQSSSSKNLLAKSGQLGFKQSQNKLKPFKSHRDFENKSKNLEQQIEDEFLNSTNKNNLVNNKNNDSSFNILSFIEENNVKSSHKINRNNVILTNNNQNKPQLFVASPDANRLRKKSFDH